jgi:hypothetical protein
MTSSYSLTSAEALSSRIRTLNERLRLLADRVEDKVIVPLRQGSKPDASTVDDVKEAITAIQSVLDDAAALGLQVDSAADLDTLFNEVSSLVAREEWHSMRQELLREVSRILNVTHSGGVAPGYLADLHGAARDFVEALEPEVDTAPTAAREWVDRGRMFRDLLTLIEAPDALSDLEAEEAIRRLDEHYGRSITNALATRRLVVSACPPPEAPEGGIVDTQASDLAVATSGTPDEAAEPIGQELGDLWQVKDTPSTGAKGSLTLDDDSRGFAEIEGPADIAESPLDRPESQGHAEAFTDSGALDESPAQGLELLVQKDGETEKGSASSTGFGDASQGVTESQEPMSTESAVLDRSGSQLVACESEEFNDKSDLTNESDHLDLSSVIAPAPNSSACVDSLGPSVRDEVWKMVADGRLGMAYHLARCVEQISDAPSVEPSTLFEFAAIAPHVRSSLGELVGHLGSRVNELPSSLAHWLDSGADEIPANLVVLGMTLRPILLSPKVGALQLMTDFGGGITQQSESLRTLREVITEYGNLHLALNANVLKGVCDQAAWNKSLTALQDEVRAWKHQNEAASIIYQPATAVWQKWLRSGHAIGNALATILDTHAPSKERISELQNLAQHWGDRVFCDAELRITDASLRERLAKRNPIEARARTAIWIRVGQFNELLQRWLSLLASRPEGSGEDFRQKHAHKCRQGVQNCLEKAIQEVSAIAESNADSLPVKGAASYLIQALKDIAQMFDPTVEEEEKASSLHVILNEELLAIDGIELDDEWLPTSSTPDVLLAGLLNGCSHRYDPEQAYKRFEAMNDHVGTQRVLEGLAARIGDKQLHERLSQERAHHMGALRLLLGRQVEETQKRVEQAVCYDLITDQERAAWLGRIEDLSLLTEDIVSFREELDVLSAIRKVIDSKEEEQYADVRRKVERLRGQLPLERESDLDRVLESLNRRELNSAREYVVLIEGNQSLSHEIDATKSVFRDFFCGSQGGNTDGFVNQINAYMGGRQANAGQVTRDLEAQRSFGPVDMRGIPGPQASKAAAMVRAWYLLKDTGHYLSSASAHLPKLLSGFGFRDVAIEGITQAKGDAKWQCVVHCSTVADQDTCIIPAFGSMAGGRYRLIGVYDRPNEDDLVNIAATMRQLNSEMPVLVIYFGRLTVLQRRRIAKRSRETRQSFLVIDEALVFFLCGERGNRLPRMFQAALPFTVSSPYTTTASLVPFEMFFGRQREREAVVDRFGTNLVYGGRQLGKSALLRDVERRTHNPSQGVICRWIDLKNNDIGTNRSTRDVWVVIGQELAALKVLASGAGDMSDKSVRKAIEKWLEVPSRRILLLLDEADAFLEADSKTLDADDRHGFPEVARLKGLMDTTDRRFKVVFAGLHNVQRAARDPNTPMGHLGEPVCIGPLLDNGEWRQARDLVEIPFRHMGYEFDPPDLWMRILSYTNYYPSLIQVFCKHLLDYLQTRQHMFSPSTCPPYSVTAQHIEDVYGSDSLRDEIRHKFELTLGLDHRYRLITLCFALASLDRREGDPPSDGHDVRWVRDEALFWWSNGFSGDTRYELFKTILDEMVGLGILRQTGRERYVLRSPNVLNLLGSRNEIEERLNGLSDVPAPLAYEPASFRRVINADGRRRSPLTAQQESLMLHPSSGVLLLCGSPLGGMHDLDAALEGLSSQVAGVYRAENIREVGAFANWLEETVYAKQSSTGGLKIAVVPAAVSWSLPWIKEALSILNRKKPSSKRFVRIVFVADPQKAWDLSLDREDLSPQIEEITLGPWSGESLRRWVDDLGLGPEALRKSDSIMQMTGGWSLLVHKFGEDCHSAPEQWRRALDALHASWPLDPVWHDSCWLPKAVVKVLEVMASLEMALSPDDVEGLLQEEAKTADVPRAFWWADRLGYLQEVKQDLWVLNGHVGLKASRLACGTDGDKTGPEGGHEQ